MLDEPIIVSLTSPVNYPMKLINPSVSVVN